MSLFRTTILLLALNIPVIVFGAESDDYFNPYVIASVLQDSNVFRLPDSSRLPPEEAGHMDDVITQIGAGFLADMPVSRQRFKLSARAQQTSFQHFDFLDYTGGNFKGEWDWATVDRLSGTVGGNYDRNLSRTIDGQGSTKNDVREGKTGFFSGSYQFHSSWSIGGAFRHEENAHNLASQSVYDNSYDQIELNSRYVSRAQTEITPYVRYTLVDYPNRSVDSLRRFDTNYHDVQFGVKGLLRPTDFIQLGAEAGGLRRVHEHISERDSTGWIGNARVDYGLTSKLALGLSSFQKIDPIEDTLADYVYANGVEATMGWAYSPYIVLHSDLGYEQRDYHGQTVGDNTRRLDKLSSASLRVSYDPWQNFSISLGINGERRASNLYAATYEYLNTELDLQLGF